MNTDKIRNALKTAMRNAVARHDELGDNWYETWKEADATLHDVDSAYSFNEFVREHGNPDDALEEMEYLDELAGCGGDWGKPTFVLQRAFYGYDYNPWHKDGDGTQREPFNPNREYFTFNGYGNLVSVREDDAMRYWASFIDEDEYLKAAEEEGRLEQVAEALGIDLADGEDAED